VTEENTVMTERSKLYGISIGLPIVDCYGVDVGTTDGQVKGFLKVRTGWGPWKKTRWIKEGDIARHTDDRVELVVSKAQLERSGWDETPSAAFSE
jgi:hypothetical protein